MAAGGQPEFFRDAAGHTRILPGELPRAPKTSRMAQPRGLFIGRQDSNRRRVIMRMPARPSTAVGRRTETWDGPSNNAFRQTRRPPRHRLAVCVP